jgi:hypothetical protein
MARPKNQVTTEQLRITIPTPLLAELELLVETGYFGASVNDAINRLVSEGVRAVHAHGREVSEGRSAYGELIRRRKGK